jgi:hypothetical protein
LKVEFVWLGYGVLLVVFNITDSSLFRLVITLPRSLPSRRVALEMKVFAALRLELVPFALDVKSLGNFVMLILSVVFPIMAPGSLMGVSLSLDKQLWGGGGKLS